MKRLNDFRYREFHILAFLMILLGLAIDGLTGSIEGIKNILTAESILLSDYMEIGGVGASFVNAGFMLLISIFIANRSGARLTGALISAFFTLVGFSFFGKNFINSLPLMLGVYLYTLYSGQKISSFMHIMCFVTGISPMVSLLMFGLGLDLPKAILLGLLVGTLVGFIIIPLSSSMLKFHDGYSLYNGGFTLGIIAIVFAGIVRMFGKEMPAINRVYEGSDLLPFLFLLGLSISFMSYGIIKNSGIGGYKKYILSHSGRLITDFTIESNKYLVVFNIGLLGIISMAYVKLCGGIFNGPIVGGVLTVMGFGAFGKHPKNVIPIILGVYIASSLNKYDPSSTAAILTALFATTIAPIAGEFGFLAGVIAGFLHKAVATNVGYIHGGINLYNNGLAGGLVAGILAPLFKNFYERKKYE